MAHKIGYVASSLLLLGLPLAAAVAEETPSPLTASFYERLRYEYVGWNASTGNAKEREYGYGHSKFQFGAKYKSEPIQAFIQGQYFQLFNLPENGVGPGASYRSFNESHDNPGDVTLRQAYLEYNDAQVLPFSAKAGRYLYANGGEYVNSSKSLEALKAQRIQNRVLGTFDFTAGRSFDGAVLKTNSSPDWGGSLAYFMPTQGGFSTEGSIPIDDISVLALTGSLGGAQIGTASDVQLFYYLYSDDRSSTVETDNRPLPAREETPLDLTIHNFGAHWANTYDVGGNEAQSLAWGIVQSGDWDQDDHFAGAFALEGGITFSERPCKPTVRLGYNWGSGDNNAADGDHNTFFQMLPTARQYAYVPFYNLMNSEDFFVSLSAKPLDGLTVLFETHALSLQSGSDLLYAGGGAAVEERSFGFAGSPLTSGSNLGLLPQITVNYEFTPELSASVFYGHLFPGSGFESYSGDASIDYAFIELTYRTK